ncbi:DUF2437 domain-containing protein, partial [Streptosporangium vulgare]|uniref:DUF2437 domain-containing protein n=1 Tax=Streptosporangium vulgare TaxID=46190 RepID=UPI0031D04132
MVEGGRGRSFISGISGHPFGPIQFTGERYSLSQVRLVAPCCPARSSRIGKNYADHAHEMAASPRRAAG